MMKFFLIVNCKIVVSNYDYDYGIFIEPCSIHKLAGCESTHRRHRIAFITGKRLYSIYACMIVERIQLCMQFVVGIASMLIFYKHNRKYKADISYHTHSKNKLYKTVLTLQPSSIDECALKISLKCWILLNQTS